MSDWGTPPGLVDSETRSDSPSNDMRTAQLERQRKLREQAEKKKRRHQLGKIERNEVTSARKRDGKTPLVSTSVDPSEPVSRYAYDNPEAYNDGPSETVDKTTSVKVVNVAPQTETLDISDSSLSDNESSNHSLPAPAKSQSLNSIRSNRTPSPAQTPQQPVTQQRSKKPKKRESKSKPQEQAFANQRIEEQPQSFESDEDEMETVLPDPVAQVGATCCGYRYWSILWLRFSILVLSIVTSLRLSLHDWFEHGSVTSSLLCPIASNFYFLRHLMKPIISRPTRI